MGVADDHEGEGVPLTEDALRVRKPDLASPVVRSHEDVWANTLRVTAALRARDGVVDHPGGGA